MDDIRAKLDADVSRRVYCVYHDHTGGFMAPYRMTIGYRASGIDYSFRQSASTKAPPTSRSAPQPPFIVPFIAFSAPLDRMHQLEHTCVHTVGLGPDSCEIYTVFQLVQ